MPKEEPDTFDIEDVVERGLCIGCGGCAVRTSGKISVEISKYGVFQANLGDTSVPMLNAATRVCPMANQPTDESALAAQRFSSLPEDKEIGRHKKVIAGRLTDDAQLVGSSSGGMTGYVLQQMIQKDAVDGVIHVGKGDSGSLFSYTISYSQQDIIDNRKSAYYASSFADVFQAIKGDGKRYAFVGIPCFVKAARLLVNEMPEFEKQILFFVGLLCGHMKSQFFAESLGWQLGIPPKDLESLDFRVKDPATKSNLYDYNAISLASHDIRSQKVADTVDGNWGYAAFQPEACNFCDDVFAETADVVFGDAWLPEYTDDWRGTNVSVVRDEFIESILTEAVEDGTLQTDELSVERAALSQAGNFRHRRDGLRVRLADDIKAGLSVPRKRVDAGYEGITKRRLWVIRRRRSLSRLSLRTFKLAREQNDLDLYLKPFIRGTRRYDWLSALDRGPIGVFKLMAKTLLGRR